MTILIAIATLLLSIPAPPPNAYVVGGDQSKQGQAEEPRESKQGIAVESPANAQDGKKHECDCTKQSNDRLYTIYLISSPILTLLTIGLICGAWKQNAAIKNAERAWLMVDLTNTPGYPSSGYSEGNSYADITLKCRNNGPTPCWIDEVRAEVAIIDRHAKPPDIEKGTRRVFTGPLPVEVGGEASPSISFTCTIEGFPALDQHVVVFGVVKYRHPFSRKARTTFAYWSVSGHPWERLYGFSEYNAHT